MEVGARVRTYAMLSCAIVGVKTVRASIASLVPFIVQGAGLSVTESALLLSAFFPGYAISQVPAGGITQMFGGKLVLTVSLGGTAAMIALAPTLSRLQNATRWLSACLLGMGLAQGLMGPASSSLFQAWMPREGVERVWVQKLLGLSHEVPNTIGAFLTPLLCRGSWHHCCYFYGAALTMLTTFFQLCGANRPPNAKSRLTAPAKASETEQAVVAKPQIKAVEMGYGAVPHLLSCLLSVSQGLQHLARVHVLLRSIFRVPAVQATISNFFGYTWLSYTMLLLGPTLFITKLGCDPVTAGRYIALGASVNIPGQFAMGALETALLRAGITELSIQRWTSGTAAVLTSAFAVGFGLARTPLQGFVAFLGYQVCMSPVRTTVQDVSPCVTPGGACRRLICSMRLGCIPT
jgi:MFS family permease